MRHSALSAILLALVMTSASLAAPVNERLSTAHPQSSLTALNPLDAMWSNNFALPIRNGAIRSFTTHAGQLVVGGSFTQAGSTRARHVATWDGAAWHAFGDGPPVSQVNALAVYGGQLVAAGPHVPPGPGEQPTVFAWDGVQWNAIGSTSAVVRALAVYAGELYAGGDFTTINAVAASCIGRWDGTQWQPVGSGITGAAGVGTPTVRALAVHGTKLVAAGKFTNLQSVAAWDGVSWSSFGSGLQLSGAAARVEGIASSGTDLLACGAIDHSGAAVLGSRVRWNGANWAVIGPADPTQANAIGQWSGQPVTTVNGGQLARFDGSAWQTDGSPGLTPVFAIHNDGTALYCGGFPNTEAAGDGFLRYDGVSWTTVQQAWAPGMSGLNSAANDVLAFNGELYAAGFITLAGAEDHWVATNKVARWNGTAWSAIPSGLIGTAYALGTYGGSLVATVDNTVRRLDPGGWTQLGAGADAVVERTAEHGTDLIAVGGFTGFGSTAASGIARWNGSTWSPIGTGFDVHVSYPSDVVSFGGEIVVGGTFNAAGGTPANNLARWNGTAFQELGGGTNGAVTALGRFGSDLVVGGYFTHAGGLPAPGAASWNGSSWSALGDNAVTVYRFREHAGRLFAAGEFLDAEGNEVEGAAVWTGERWYPLGSGVDGPVNSVDFLGDDLYIGGNFGWANGKPSFNIARLPSISTVDVDDRPRSTSLALSASPNPTRRSVRFNMTLPTDGRVRLTVHDLSGRAIAVLADERQPAGNFSATWDAHAAPGLYFATLEAAGGRRTIRVARFE